MEPEINKISQEFSKGNFEYTYNYMAVDIEWNVVGADIIKGRGAVMAYCNKMLIEMANSTLNNTNHIVSENSIAVQGYCNYIKENNEPGKVAYCDVYRFEDGQLKDIKSYCIEIKND